MARKVIAYGCEFKCGQKIVLSKKSMEDHETRCFHNPKNRACASCKFFERFEDGNGMEGTRYNEEWITLYCRSPDNYNEIDLTSNCKFHEPK